MLYSSMMKRYSPMMVPMKRYGEKGSPLVPILGSWWQEPKKEEVVLGGGVNIQ